MLHREDGNSESVWSITEEHLTAPVVDTSTQGAESFSSHVMTDESSEINVSSLGPTLLIGLDKNFFEQGDDSKDVIFIENSDLKFATSELKIDGPSFSGQKPFLASGNYLISFVGRSKASIPWENTTLRNIRKIRSDVGCSLADEIFEPLVSSESAVSDLRDVRQDDPALSESAASGLLDVRQDDPALSDPTLVAVTLQETSSTYNVDRNTLEDSEHSQLLNAEKMAEERLEKCAGELSQESLPLKKKAKMKSSETRIFGTDENLGESLSTSAEAASVVSEPSIKYRTVSKNEKEWRRRAQRKRRCCYSESDNSDGDDGETPNWGIIADIQSYQNANDLVEDLKSKTLVDDDFAQLILSGISEMKIDVVEELKAPSAEDHKFSYELLTFAFLLYFKRRPAYQYLRTVFQDRWPTVQNLKEWGKLVNSNPKRLKKLLTKTQTINNVSS